MGDHPDKAVAMTMVATLAVQRTGAAAFKACNDHANLLKPLGRQLRNFAKYNAVVVFDEPT